MANLVAAWSDACPGCGNLAIFLVSDQGDNTEWVRFRCPFCQVTKTLTRANAWEDMGGMPASPR